MLSNLESKVNSAIVLANAGELVSKVIQEISGNDISNSLNGSRISNELVQTIAYQRISKNLEDQLKSN